MLQMAGNDVGALLVQHQLFDMTLEMFACCSCL
jgi:hypothetical protein